MTHNQEFQVVAPNPNNGNQQNIYATNRLPNLNFSTFWTRIADRPLHSFEVYGLYLLGTPYSRRLKEVVHQCLAWLPSERPGSLFGMQYFSILNSKISREARGGETCFGRKLRHMSFLLLLLPYKEMRIQADKPLKLSERLQKLFVYLMN